MNKKPIVIITGTGFRTKIEGKIEENIFSSSHIKINIGCATAKILAGTDNYDLILISKTQSKLDAIKKSIQTVSPSCCVNVQAIDILNRNEIAGFIGSLDKKRSYYFVHCAGLNTGAYSIKNDNPYLPVEDIPIDLPGMEFEAVVKSLHIMLLNLLPYFNKQSLTKIVIVNSMSGLRPYPKGYSHSSAKAGMHNAVRSLTLELTPRNILISEVNPGIVDTGIYDNIEVQDSVKEIAVQFGYDYKNLPMMSPLEVAKAVNTCLESDAHILEINMVAKGQWPNMGA